MCTDYELRTMTLKLDLNHDSANHQLSLLCPLYSTAKVTYDNSNYMHTLVQQMQRANSKERVRVIAKTKQSYLLINNRIITQAVSALQ